MALAQFGEVTTERLLVRPLRDEDLPALLDVNGDAEVTRYLPYETWRGVEDAQAWLARMQRFEANGDTRQLVAVRRSDGLAVATILLFRYEEASARAELGYALARACWRQGLAHEGVAATLEAAFTRMGIRRIEAEVDPRNKASCALLERLGFHREGQLRERWVTRGEAHDVIAYGLLARDWMAARPVAGDDGGRRQA
jgi:ribosomal-protein-alanine N-acetyltransferase